MKRYLILIFLTYAIAFNTRAAELEGGIFNNGSTLQIFMKPVGGSFNSPIHAVQFAIKYSAEYSGVVIDTPKCSTGILLNYYETQTSDSGYIYKFYQWRDDINPYIPEWNENSENLIMEVTVSGGTGVGEFSLVSSKAYVNSSDPNWYVEGPDLQNGYSSAIYHGSVDSVLLPVQLSAGSTPKQFALYQNYPNPFNPSTTIKFDLPYESKVILNVYNILGEKISTLVNGILQGGFHEVQFNSSNLPSGIYIYKIEAGKFIKTRKMLLLK